VWYLISLRSVLVAVVVVVVVVVIVVVVMVVGVSARSACARMCSTGTSLTCPS
jgi:hypothetical protein